MQGQDSRCCVWRSLSPSTLLLLSPSSAATIAEFQEPIGFLIVHPLLQFLDETNSSFLINLLPYHILKINSEIPIEFVLFHTNPFNFCDDDMMIVAEIGWPTGSEAEDAGNYAEMYLRGLIMHLRSGSGTPLFGEGILRGTISNSNGTSSDAAVFLCGLVGLPFPAVCLCRWCILSA